MTTKHVPHDKKSIITNLKVLASKNWFIDFLFLVVWAVFFYLNGAKQLFRLMGGLIEFYLLIPVIVVLSIKSRQLNKIKWSIILILSGLIIVNYLYSYLLLKDKLLNPFFLFNLFFIPAVFVPIGYGIILSDIFNLKRQNIKRESPEFKALKNFFTFYIGVFFIPLFSVLPVMFNYPNFAQIGNLGYQVILAGIIFGSLFFTIAFRKVKLNSSAKTYYSKNQRMLSLPKFRRFAVAALLVLFIFSFASELEFRGHWVIWAETIIILTIYLIFLMKIPPALYVSVSSSGVFIVDTKKLPFSKNRNNAILIGILITMILTLDVILDFIFG